MKVLALDNSKSALEMLAETIAEARPEAEIFSFSNPFELVAFAKDTICDVAFLDIEMPGMNGLQVAKALKDDHPAVNIIFVTGYSEYVTEALPLYFSGYVMKPVTKEAVERELENLRHPVDIKAGTKVFVQTFGNFEVFVDEKPIVFKREKAKEVFAFLIDRQGAFVRAAEIAACIWEDREYNRSLQNQLQVIISAMTKTLRDYGIEDVIIQKWNRRAVDRRKLVCDYYDVLKWDAKAINTYRGEYMSNYPWAEMTAASLSQKILSDI